NPRPDQPGGPARQLPRDDNAIKSGQMSTGQVVLLVAGGIALLLGVIALLILFSFLRLLIQCYFTRAGIGILDLVGMKLRNIDYPDPCKGRPTLDGVCRNGIQLRAKARVTVRTKLDRLVGGATEETIIARVGEGIVKAIGSAEHHTDVLANPNLISQAVLTNSLDSQTAFEIVSIDVAEIDVGANIGANLQAD